MAAVGEEGLDYESDPEEAKRALTMRRREASDDEGEEGGETERPPRSVDSRTGIDSDGELDGEGAPADYDEEESEVADEDVEEDEEELDEEAVEEDYVEGGGEEELGDGYVGGVAAAAEGLVDEEEAGGDIDFEGSTDLQELNEEDGEKKKAEPFAVPTAGAFYMHDDRFGGRGGGRNRRTFGGRRLWESKDDNKWGHDKFEEMTAQEGHYERGRRNSRGHSRGRGKIRGSGRGYPRGNKNEPYENSNQNNVPKGFRGRGPRKYEPSKQNNMEAPNSQHKHRSTSGRTPPAMSHIEEKVPARKQVPASSLSSASPPFYPSGNGVAMTQKKDVQTGTINQSLQSAAVDEKRSRSQPNTMIRGKNVLDSTAMEKLYINDSFSSIGGKPSTNMHFASSGSSNNATQPRAQGARGFLPSGQNAFQPGFPLNQATGTSLPSQLHAVQQSLAQSRGRSSPQGHLHQLGQHPGNGSQISSTTKATLDVNTFEGGVRQSSSESNKSKTALVGKGTNNVQGSVSGTFPYGGAQSMVPSGNIGSGPGDQNFTPTPAFLPVMPFGGQHPRGIPAVGMAFPGYVAQKNGVANPEMTWFPVLAGAAGALGATYCPPYITLDGAYHSHTPSQTSSSSSKESSAMKMNNERKPSQRSEAASDEFGQRQKNTRRYTEMNFGK